MSVSEKTRKGSKDTSSSGLSRCSWVVVAVLGVAVAYFLKTVYGLSDLLNGSTSDTVLSDPLVQLGFAGFCLSPLVSAVNKTIEQQYSEYSFQEHGGINEEDYDKGSIYSFLYSIYANIGEIGKTGAFGEDNLEDFEFTFNTWGIATPETADAEAASAAAKSKKGGGGKVLNTDPQRHGKASYGWLPKKSQAVQDYVAARGGKVQVVEIGCGTGAGANYLTTEVLTNAAYMAIDMQRAAINTCNRLHASERLTCQHMPEGVGNYNAADSAKGRVPLPDGSVDIAIILETHIAEDQIGPEEKAIFAEIRRVVKPGGFFLWGNALPTDVWLQSEEYLPTAGFRMLDRYNNTMEAVVARDEDAPRVNRLMRACKEHHVAFKMPYFGEPCWFVVEKLVRNFYRDPSTALYEKMVRGQHSYMHYAWQVE